MKHRICHGLSWSVFAFLAMSSAGAAEPPKDADKAGDGVKLLGKWQAVAGEYDGKPLTAQECDHFGLMIDKDYFTTVSGGKPLHRHTYKLDTAAAPKGIALRTVDTRALFDRSAIYELDGDTLKICIVHGAKRPARFATQKGGATSTYILKKQ